MTSPSNSSFSSLPAMTISSYRWFRQVSVFAGMPVAALPPVVVEPAPYQVSFGRIAGTAGPGTRRIVVTVAGQRLGERELRGRRFAIEVVLPRRDVAIRVTALDADGRGASTVVTPVFGLPGGGA